MIECLNLTKSYGGRIGLCLGALVRSMPAAVAALFALPAMIEPLSAMVLGQLRAGAPVWLPFGAVGQVVSQSPALGGPSPIAGAVIFLAGALGLIAVSVRVFTRRDV